MAPIRLSFINFLNSVPLGWGFLDGAEDGFFRVDFDVPSECARRLREGEADVGLIPVIEYQRIPGLQVVPGISVSSRQEVHSVVCVSRRPLESARRVALDTASRTSVALLKILLASHFGNPDVAFIDSAPDLSTMLDSADAALLIGNPALQIDRSGLQVYDLAAEWHRFTGLPFVFAFWAARAQVSEPTLLCRKLEDSRARGLESLPRIARDYGPQLGLSPAEALRYLTCNLDYALGPEHCRALERFYELAEEMGLIERRRPVEWLAAEPVGRQ